MEHFPRHWDVAEDRVQDPAGRTFRLRIWGWSTSSAGQAAIAARRRLAEVVQKVRSGQPLGEGYYHRNPPREEVLRERSEEHTSELQSRGHLVCRLLLE